MGDISIKGKSPILRKLEELKALVTGTRKVWPLTEEKKKKLEEDFAAPWDKDAKVIPELKALLEGTKKIKKKPRAKGRK